VKINAEEPVAYNVVDIVKDYVTTIVAEPVMVAKALVLMVVAMAAKETVKVIVWELAKRHAKAVAKTLVAEVVLIHAPVVPKCKQMKKHEK
jgi:hypothetical protein